jgi:hypothetical protein
VAIQLTEQQQQALDSAEGIPPEVIDPRTNASYVLIPTTEYEAVREILEDERRQAAIRAAALRNAVGRINEAP